jgi:hypothetical protein
MGKLEIKSRNGNYNPTYKKADNTTVFMRHENDRIEFRNGEQVNIDIYDNGTLIFSGDKYELYEKLKENKEV